MVNNNLTAAGATSHSAHHPKSSNHYQPSGAGLYKKQTGSKSPLAASSKAAHYNNYMIQPSHANAYALQLNSNHAHQYGGNVSPLNRNTPSASANHTQHTTANKQVALTQIQQVNNFSKQGGQYTQQLQPSNTQRGNSNCIYGGNNATSQGAVTCAINVPSQSVLQNNPQSHTSRQHNDQHFSQQNKHNKLMQSSSNHYGTALHKQTSHQNTHRQAQDRIGGNNTHSQGNHNSKSHFNQTQHYKTQVRQKENMMVSQQQQQQKEQSSHHHHHQHQGNALKQNMHVLNAQANYQNITNLNKTQQYNTQSSNYQHSKQPSKKNSSSNSHARQGSSHLNQQQHQTQIQSSQPVSKKTHYATSGMNGPQSNLYNSKGQIVSQKTQGQKATIQNQENQKPSALSSSTQRCKEKESSSSHAMYKQNRGTPNFTQNNNTTTQQHQTTQEHVALDYSSVHSKQQHQASNKGLVSSRQAVNARNSQLTSNTNGSNGNNFVNGAGNQHPTSGSAVGVASTHRSKTQANVFSNTTSQANTNNTSSSFNQFSQQNQYGKNTLQEYKQYMEKQKQMLKQLSTAKLSQMLHQFNQHSSNRQTNVKNSPSALKDKTDIDVSGNLQAAGPQPNNPSKSAPKSKKHLAKNQGTTSSTHHNGRSTEDTKHSQHLLQKQNTDSSMHAQQQQTTTNNSQLNTIQQIEEMMLKFKQNLNTTQQQLTSDLQLIQNKNAVKQSSNYRAGIVGHDHTKEDAQLIQKQQAKTQRDAIVESDKGRENQSGLMLNNDHFNNENQTHRVAGNDDVNKSNNQIPQTKELKLQHPPSKATETQDNKQSENTKGKDNTKPQTTGAAQQNKDQQNTTTQGVDPRLQDESMMFSQKSSLSDYVIGKQIGEGAYAVVRIGLHKPSNKNVAMKIYKKHKLLDANRRRSVKREIKLMEKMRHPNIIKLYEIIDTHKYVILVMEYVGGGSLHGYLKSKPNRRLDERDAQRIFRQIIEGLNYCHNRCITHRDIKLENLLLDHKCNIKMIDFGFSTCIPNDKKIKIFCGTPSYMAPEIVQKTEYCGPPADIWALGVLLYTCLFGCFPYRGQTDAELYKKICRADFKLHQEVVDTLSKNAILLLKRLFTIDADSRISAEEILQHPWFTESGYSLNPQKVLTNSRSHSSQPFSSTIVAKSSRQQFQGKTSNNQQETKAHPSNNTVVHHSASNNKVQSSQPYKTAREMPQGHDQTQQQQYGQEKDNSSNNLLHNIKTNRQAPTIPLTTSSPENIDPNSKKSEIDMQIVETIVQKLGYTEQEVKAHVIADLQHKSQLAQSPQNNQSSSTQLTNPSSQQNTSSTFVSVLYQKLLAEKKHRYLVQVQQQHQQQINNYLLQQQQQQQQVQQPVQENTNLSKQVAGGATQQSCSTSVLLYPQFQNNHQTTSCHQQHQTVQQLQGGNNANTTSTGNVNTVQHNDQNKMLYSTQQQQQMQQNMQNQQTGAHSTSSLGAKIGYQPSFVPSVHSMTSFNNTQPLNQANLNTNSNQGNQNSIAYFNSTVNNSSANQQKQMLMLQQAKQSQQVSSPQIILNQNPSPSTHRQQEDIYPTGGSSASQSQSNSQLNLNMTSYRSSSNQIPAGTPHVVTPSNQHHGHHPQLGFQQNHLQLSNFYSGQQTPSNNQGNLVVNAYGTAQNTNNLFYPRQMQLCSTTTNARLVSQQLSNQTMLQQQQQQQDYQEQTQQVDQSASQIQQQQPLTPQGGMALNAFNFNGVAHSARVNVPQQQTLQGQLPYNNFMTTNSSACNQQDIQTSNTQHKHNLLQQWRRQNNAANGQ